MKKKFTPKTLIKYLIKEFFYSLLIFLGIFLSLIILTNYIEEIIFFRNQITSNDLFLKTLLLSLIKTPTLLINISPFIFLFSGLFYFAKLMRSNEISPLSLSGFSLNFIALVPAIFSFFIGVLVILILTPISSKLSKYYETEKQKYYSNDNLIIMSNTGLWVKEKKDDYNFIIRADKIEDQSFNKLSNITIYKFDDQNNLVDRIDGKYAEISNNKWIIKDAIKLSDSKSIKVNQILYQTNINLFKLKSFFINPNTFSIWDIPEQISQIKKIGYFGQELIIAFNKYLATPILLFSMIIIASIFTIKIGIQFNNYIYSFLGILVGITFYFLTDLSIAIGKSGKIPLIFAVWIPILIIMIISLYSLTKDEA